MYNSFIMIFRFIFKIIYKTEIIGKENIPKNKGFILASNHKNNLDPIFISANFNEHIHWMAKKELFKFKLLGWVLKKVGVFSIDRDNIDVEAIKTAFKLLKDNKIVGMFPEGTRTKNVNYNNAKSGIIVIAQRTKSLILPVYVEGDYTPFKKMKIIIRKPIDLTKIPRLKTEEYKKSTYNLMKTIYEGD